MKSVYVIGSAGSGKSTFMRQLLDLAGLELGPLETLHQLANPKNIVTLRGHRTDRDGLYLGLMRDSFPGTDGLDRASSPVGEAWLKEAELPRFLISEGATLATSRFLNALAFYSSLLLVHLHVDPVVADLRFAARGSSQNDRFVEATRTKSRNLFEKIPTESLSIDTNDPIAWGRGLDTCLKWLEL